MEQITTQTFAPTEYTNSYADNLLRIALDIGEGLLTNGAEVHRIEFTVEKICRAYGALHVEVFTINSLILASVRMQDGSYSAQNRRITSISNNLLALEHYNSLSREICENTPDFDEIDRKIRGIKQKNHYSAPLLLLGHVLAAAAFAMFFGGSLRDGIAAGLVGILIFLLSRLKARYFTDMAKTLLTAFAAGLASCLFVIIGLGERMDMIAIGTIMLLIPGLSLGNAMRDMFGGDTLSGTLKVVQACITAIVIAIGYALSIAMLGGFCESKLCAPFGDVGMLVCRLISSFIGTVGFALIFKIAPKRCWVAGLGGLFTYVVYELSVQLGAGVLVASFLAALLMSAYSEGAARLFKAPAILFLFPCAIPIVPGSALYYTMYHLLYYHAQQSVSYLKVTGQTILGIALGLSVASIAVGASMDLYKKISSYKKRS